MTKRSKIIIIVVLLAMIAALMFTLLFNMGWIRSRKGALPREDAKLRYPYSQLSATEKALYGALYRGVVAREDTISLPGTYDKNTYTRVYLLLAEQEPQFFYLDSVYETADLMDKANMRYKVPKDEIDMMRAAMNVRADAIISQIPSDADDIQKLLAIHDGIAAGCDYTDGDYQDEAYGCLEAGEAKCEGYAKAFLFTARRAGLNVMNVTGKDSTGENHVWNIAEANGNYYQIDVTWDDDAQYRGHYTHTCFAMTDDDFADHIADVRAYQPPACTDTENDYYHRERFWLNGGSAMLDTIRTWPYDCGVIEFRMSSEAAMQEAKSLIEKGGSVRQEITNACGAMSYQALADDNRNVIVILPS